MKFYNLSVLLIFFSCAAGAQRLELFTSAPGKVMNKGVSEDIPYNKVITYFDLLGADEKADTIINGSPWYFIYFKVPSEVTEIGIRMISPVPPYASPMPGDIETNRFNIKVKEYFDPSICLEQYAFDSLASDTTWQLLGKNDNSGETISQPDGGKTNALLRTISPGFQPGIYRVRFMAGKKPKEVDTSYMVSIGLIPGLKGVKISRTIKGILED